MTERRRDPRVDPPSIPPDERPLESSADPKPNRDPRAEPESVPPLGGDTPSSKRKAEPIVERVAISAVVADKAPSTPPSDAPRQDPVVSADPRMEAVERRINDNDWKGIVSELGSLDEVGRLPPNLGLVAALAHHEADSAGNQEAVAVGIRCMAAILNVPENSRTAGVIARRLFRKFPVRFRERKAPPARVSVLIMVVTLVLAGTVGWLLSGGWGVVRSLLRH